MNTDVVSVIIPTYNRFKFVLNTIESIKSQTYTNIEIIVVNDCSTEKEYYEYNWDGVNIIHLDQNSKQLFGFACAAYVRNKGIEQAKGKYIAFCDDDDIWFPNKIELQINAMKRTGCKISSTEGLFGHGVYDSKKNYKKCNTEQGLHSTKECFKNHNSNLFDNGYPEIWNKQFAIICNCMTTSSVIIEKEILDKINNFRCIRPPGEDYDCWLRALDHTNNVFIKEPCMYYDDNHGYGQNY
jgi:glycosyltransferase involved in cell wall biosynthesis